MPRDDRRHHGRAEGEGRLRQVARRDLKLALVVELRAGDVQAIVVRLLDVLRAQESLRDVLSDVARAVVRGVDGVGDVIEEVQRFRDLLRRGLRRKLLL